MRARATRALPARFEESYGYLSGGYVRDKDAVNGSMLICEMASFYKNKGMTLVDAINGLYEKYGYYKNDLCNFAFEGEDGMKKMNAIMDGLRMNPPQEIAGCKVIGRSDYKLSVRTDGEEKTTIELPKSNVLELPPRERQQADRASLRHRAEDQDLSFRQGQDARGVRSDHRGDEDRRDRAARSVKSKSQAKQGIGCRRSP